MTLPIAATFPCLPRTLWRCSLVVVVTTACWLGSSAQGQAQPQDHERGDRGDRGERAEQELEGQGEQEGQAGQARQARQQDQRGQRRGPGERGQRLRDRISPAMREGFLVKLRAMRDDPAWTDRVDALPDMSDEARRDEFRTLMSELTTEERRALLGIGRRGGEEGGRDGRQGHQGRDGRNDRGDRPSSPIELSDEEVERLVETIREIRPELADRIAEAWSDGPEIFRERVQRDPVMRELGPIIRLRQRDPEMYELRLEDFRLGARARGLAFQHRRADPSDQALIRDQIQHLLEEHFEVRIQIRELEIERFVQRLEELQRGVEDAYAQRDDLIGDQLDELLSNRPFPQTEHANTGERRDRRDRHDAERAGEESGDGSPALD